MDRISKINSVQGGSFNADQNLCDFVIPAGSVINMKKSYLMINCDIQNDNSTGINNTVLVKTSFANGEKFSLVPSEIMIKHADLRFENVGMVENIRDVNVLKCNMKQYSEDPIKKVCDSYRSFNGINNGNTLSGSPFRDLVKSGSVVSTNKSHDIRVDMSDIFGLGQVEQLDTNRLGQGSMHLTLDFDDIAFQTFGGKTADDTNGGGYWSLIESRSNPDATLLSNNGSVGTRDGSETAGTITAASVAGAIYEMTRNYDSLEDSPFHIGQNLEYTYSIDGGGAGGANQKETKTITNILYNTATLKISLTVDSALNSGAATKLNNVSLTGIDSSTNSFVVNNVTFVMYEDISNQKSPSSIEYKTYTVERDTENAITSYSKMFYIEPECANMFVLCPNGNGASPSKYISDLDISDYRLRVNGADLTNRPIKINTPEHWDRLGRTFLNMDMQLQSIRSKVPKISNQRANEEGTPEVKLIAECFPVTSSPKMVQVDINSVAGVETIYLFKEVIRQI